MRSICAGKALTRPRKSAITNGDHANRSGPLWARRNPIPMPRKLPSKTKLAKYDRCTIQAPAHLIATSSTKSIRKLAATQLEALSAHRRRLAGRN